MTITDYFNILSFFRYQVANAYIILQLYNELFLSSVQTK